MLGEVEELVDLVVLERVEVEDDSLQMDDEKQTALGGI